MATYSTCPRTHTHTGAHRHRLHLCAQRRAHATWCTSHSCSSPPLAARAAHYDANPPPPAVSATTRAGYWQHGPDAPVSGPDADAQERTRQQRLTALHSTSLNDAHVLTHTSPCARPYAHVLNGMHTCGSWAWCAGYVRAPLWAASTALGGALEAGPAPHPHQAARTHACALTSAHVQPHVWACSRMGPEPMWRMGPERMGPEPTRRRCRHVLGGDREPWRRAWGPGGGPGDLEAGLGTWRRAWGPGGGPGGSLGTWRRASAGSWLMGWP
jgi:hypothetical protein